MPCPSQRLRMAGDQEISLQNEQQFKQVQGKIKIKSYMYIDSTRTVLGKRNLMSVHVQEATDSVVQAEGFAVVIKLAAKRLLARAAKTKSLPIDK